MVPCGHGVFVKIFTTSVLISCLGQYLGAVPLPWDLLSWGKVEGGHEARNCSKGKMFPLFQSLGTSLDCCDFPNIIDSGSATSSTTSFGTCKYISSDSIDLRTFRLLRCTWTWSSPTEHSSSFSQSLLLPSVTQPVWLEHLLMKTNGKKILK